MSIGIEKIKVAYFEHRGKGLYAFEFISDNSRGIIDYFDDKAKNLRRAFLKSPVKFSRISSRYNLKKKSRIMVALSLTEEQITQHQLEHP